METVHTATDWRPHGAVAVRRTELEGDSQDSVDRCRRASQLLALGLAFVFLYAGATTLLGPSTYRSYLPTFLRAGSPWSADLYLRLFAVYEVALAVGLLAHRSRHEAALLSAVTLLGIIAVNADAFEVLFRNVAIGFAAFALASLTGKGKRRPRRREPSRSPGRSAGR